MKIAKSNALMLTIGMALVAVSLAVAGDVRTDFRKSHWGDSKTDVLASESAAPAMDNGNMLLYDTTAGGLDVRLSYTFAAGKLVRANYAFANRHASANDYIDDFERVRATLSGKYGAPGDDEQVWKSSARKTNNPVDWGTALQAGDLVYEAQWITKTTEIVERLEGKNSEVILRLQYRSIELGSLEDREYQHKADSDF